MAKRIVAENLAAQLMHRAEGNPPSTMPDAAISNAYPGLEMDIRNLWKCILEGIELHESSNAVVGVDETHLPQCAALKNKYQLIKVQGIPVTATVKGPAVPGGPDGPLPHEGPDSIYPLEWSNALAQIVRDYTGQMVECEFESLDAPVHTLKFDLKVRSVFEEVDLDGRKIRRAVIARDIAEPGALTQSLCSPWQNDYRECACFYWAASRPDYVNVDNGPDGVSIGHNWMHKNRSALTPKLYVVDDWLDERLLTHEDLMRDWEQALRFVIGNKDSE